MRTHTALSAAIVPLVALAGCTAGAPPSPGEQPAASGQQNPGQQNPGQPNSGQAAEVDAGAAPFAAKENRVARLDEVTRAGDVVTLGLTLATADDDLNVGKFSAPKITTNTGTTVELAAGEKRTIPKNSQAAVSMSVPLPEPSVRELQLEFGSDGPKLAVPVPDKDGSRVWRPAALRQTGLAAKPQRTERSELVVGSIRSEGLITEVEFQAGGLQERPVSVCSYNFTVDNCFIREPDGTTHPVLAAETLNSAKDGRLRGTLRFLGELKPDVTDLTLSISSDTTVNKPDAIAVTLPRHDGSPAVAAAGNLARPKADQPPIELKHNKTGATVTITGVDVLTDHIQVHVSAKGGKQDFRLESTASRGRSALIEPSGFRHDLVPPADAEFVVRAGGTMEATLAFQGSLPADVTALTLELGDGYTGEPLTTPITVAQAPDAAPPAGATLGQAQAPPAPAPVLTAKPAPAPTPTATDDKPTASITAFDVKPLQVSTQTAVSGVLSAIKGVTPAGQTSSATTVDADAEAKAQRTLEDLGAQRTPDGWVLTLPETVLFDYNKADVKPEAAAKLDEIAKLLAYFDKAKIGVQGHTDSTGEAAYNLDLSKRRAQAVADALAGKGVSSGRMTVEGFGLTKPIASNADDAGKAKNRRVEIVLRESA